MKIKKTCFSTQLSELYGRDTYQSHIEVGREYWWYFDSYSNIGKKYGSNWYKIKITYIRSECMFYIFSDYPDIKEDFCSINSFLASTLEFAEIDPIKDLGDTFGNIEIAKIKYCFDTSHTIVKNWPNEREIEIDDDEINNKVKNSSDYIDILSMTVIK